MKSKPIMPEYKPAAFDVSRSRGLTNQQIVSRVFESRNALDAFIPRLSLSWDFDEGDERLTFVVELRSDGDFELSLHWQVEYYQPEPESEEKEYFYQGTFKISLEGGELSTDLDPAIPEIVTRISLQGSSSRLIARLRGKATNNWPLTMSDALLAKLQGAWIDSLPPWIPLPGTANCIRTLKPTIDADLGCPVFRRSGPSPSFCGEKLTIVPGERVRGANR
jgi:hypothetical protein